jgi:flagellar basal-body rod protein FlgB
MKGIRGQMFSQGDSTLESTLNHRLQKQKVIVSNIANSQTPGYRALGYDFETQLQKAIQQSSGKGQPMAATHPGHFRGQGVTGDGQFKPDLHVKATESIGNDGNSVDVDREMAELAENQIIYQFTVEILNRRLGMLRYGINGG